MDFELIVDNEEEVIWKKVTRAALSYCLQSYLGSYPFKDEEQTALFKDPVRTAL